MRKFKTNSDTRKNVTTLAFLSLAVGVLLILRFGQLMINKTVNNIDLVEYGQNNDMGSSITEARRGTIFDQNGQPIAMDTTSYSMYAVLNSSWDDNEVVDTDYTASVLSNYLDLTQDEILTILLNPDANQVEFGEAGKNITPDTKTLIDNENLPGIKFDSQVKRQYVNDYFASHLIGYAVTEFDEELNTTVLKGQIGIESGLDGRLSGIDQYKTNLDNNIQADYLSGDDVYLTLDSRLQNFMEDLLDINYKRYQPEEVSAYLVEVETGRLLTAAQRPSFNLNTREGIEQKWTNMLVEEAFEPGSTIKILTLATSYDLGLYQPGETFMSGEVAVYDQIVRDYNLYGWGEITFDEGLSRSSNVGVVKLVERMGEDKWVQVLEELGFGKSTQSGLPNETEGSLQFDNPVSKIMSSFGQGFAASPIQLLQAYTTIGNDGKQMKIQYIDRMKSSQNTFESEVLGQPITEEAADHVLGLMVNTVEESYGTAQDFKNQTVNIAAKTGTAQIADPNGNGYLTGDYDYYFSVVAFFPAEDPEFMLYISMKQPNNPQGRTGSQILSEIFHPFVENVMINQ